MLESRIAPVSVYLTVYNEEQQIADCLSCLQWASEIIVFDKSSSDRTASICRSMGAFVVPIPNDDIKRTQLVHSYGSSEFCLFVTASDRIHINLASKVVRCLNSDQSSDAYFLPFKHYSFQVNPKHSAFSSLFKISLIRRSTLLLRNEIHREISTSSENIGSISPSDPLCYIHHLSNSNLSVYFSQLPRYLALERDTNTYSSKRFLFYLFRQTLGTIFRCRVFTRSGFAQFASWIGYQLLVYAALWDRETFLDRNNPETNPFHHTCISRLCVNSFFT